MSRDVTSVKNVRFLDGIRGVASLYVVCHHFMALSQDGLSRLEKILVSWAAFGHFMVGIFIVLSGFSLSLGVASTEGYILKGGIVDYFKRRVRRIFPPYYVSLILALIFTYFTSSPNGLDADIVFKHLLIVHNWFRSAALSYNAAHWTVATEWQIYFLFPLVFLPVWRTWGIYAVIAVGFIIGVLPQIIAPEYAPFDTVCPWYAGLFTLGMFGAYCATDKNWYSSFWSKKISVILLSISLLYVLAKVLGASHWGSGRFDTSWIMDWLAGGIAVSLILILMKDSHDAMINNHRLNLVNRFLDSKILRFLGKISYSLYLNHYVLYDGINYFGHKMSLSDHNIFILRVLLGVPLSVVVAYLLYLVAEKPFMSRRVTPQLAT